MRIVRSVFTAFAMCLCVASLSPFVNAQIAEYYVGRDSLSTVGGVYAGLANPNLNRMTFLYAHSYPDPALGLPGSNWTINHYHSKGTYSYTGGVNLGAATPVNDFNGTYGVSNILPESPLVNDITMRAGSGLFSGLYHTGFDNSSDFNNLRFRSVNSLSGFAPGTGEHFMFNSSGGRWSGLLDGTDVFLNLLSIDSGLSIRDTSGAQLLSAAGQSINLGAGNSIDFTPIFAATAPGTYRAEFNLSNPSGSLGNGGRFIFEVTAIPEPSGVGLLSLTIVGFVLRRYRRS